MRRLLAFLLLCAAGCSGFEAPTPSDFERLGIPARSTVAEIFRLKFRMSIDSDALAGEYDGVLLVRQDETGPTVRLQLFGDLGPKVVEVKAQRSRIVGWFPQTREAVDCAFPGEAAPHPLLFMGATLVERFTEVIRSRVTGVREAEEGYSWLQLRPAIEGMTTQVLINKNGWVRQRRFSWMYGLSWTEERKIEVRGDVESASRISIQASGVSIRVEILGEGPVDLANPGVMEFRLPDDARIVLGSRK